MNDDGGQIQLCFFARGLQNPLSRVKAAVTSINVIPATGCGPGNHLFCFCFFRENHWFLGYPNLKNLPNEQKTSEQIILGSSLTTFSGASESLSSRRTVQLKSIFIVVRFPSKQPSFANCSLFQPEQQTAVVLLDPPFPMIKSARSLGAPCPQPVVSWLNQRHHLLCIYLSNSIYLCIIYNYILYIYI